MNGLLSERLYEVRPVLRHWPVSRGVLGLAQADCASRNEVQTNSGSVMWADGNQPYISIDRWRWLMRL